MCEPVSISLAIGAGITAIASVVGGVVSANEAAAAQKTNDRELARAAELEASNAVAAQAHGSVLAGRARSRGTAVRQAARVAYSQSGVDATTGTPTQLDASTVAAAELEAEAARVEAAQRAFGHKETKRRYGVARAEGERQLAANTIGTVLGAVGTGTAKTAEAIAYGVKAGKKS